MSACEVAFVVEYDDYNSIGDETKVDLDDKEIKMTIMIMMLKMAFHCWQEDSRVDDDLRENFLIIFWVVIWNALSGFTRTGETGCKGGGGSVVLRSYAYAFRITSLF